ncbi:unnamed protein product [Acanthoscelides obtectus]|uniref:Uncharacterized protein n=1 Tax=Acanthoscelides obtectus TaxID=200917 RepID=A0A9P0KXY0_ACAOB|nr:unnamed protein product [Acanthoscelides obtectus]CAK1620976.1 hypothetical protein AOBTE_LOCUS685 [Acanthoscelides obtectus]
MRKNKPQIPRELLDVKNRPVKSSLFAYGEDSDENPNKCLLVSYVPKRNKNVLLLSTLHDDGKIDDHTGDAFKPEVITDERRRRCGRQNEIRIFNSTIQVSFSSRGFQNETSEEETFSSEILDEEFSVFR